VTKIKKKKYFFDSIKNEEDTKDDSLKRKEKTIFAGKY
jgi:hypothetical protein